MSKQHLPRMRRALLGLALLASAGGAHAALVLDTGTPGSGAPNMLDDMISVMESAVQELRALG